jgi:DNA-binding MarR family transcriptional regulator
VSPGPRPPAGLAGTPAERPVRATPGPSALVSPFSRAGVWHAHLMAPRETTKLDRQVDAVMEASRAFVALVAQSLAKGEVPLTLPQWRVLAIVNRYGAQNLKAIAHWMGVHPSTATRACDALVASGLLHRREDPEDRRRIVLTLSEAGQDLADSLLLHRRQAIASVLREMPAARRSRVAEAMREFAESVGDVPEHDASSFDWAR